MQRKTSLRYLNESHAVYGEVERHFKAKEIQLPPEWNDLVAIACFPIIMEEIKLRPPPAPDERNFYEPHIRAFKACYSRDPDMALGILVFARRCLKNLQNGKTKAGKVRRFLLKYPNVIKENGELRLPKMGDADKLFFKQPNRRKVVKSIPVAALQDGEIAAMLFGANCPVKDVETVKKVRQSISFTFVDGKACYFRKGKI